MSNKDTLRGEELCKSCGLCCLGVFHPHAILYTKNDEVLTRTGNIPTKTKKGSRTKVFALPCPAFDELCTIHPKRPSVCSNHKCKLLNKVLLNKTTLEGALSTVQEMKTILNTLLPELKRLANNHKTNLPESLVNTIYDDLDDDQGRIEFNNKNKQILITLGIFRLLEARYFY